MYAAPHPANPNGPNCTIVDPCSLDIAYRLTQPGDVLDLAAGDYDLDGNEFEITTPSLRLLGGHGDPLHKAHFVNGALRLHGAGDSVDNVYVEGMLDIRASATVDRTFVSNGTTDFTQPGCRILASEVLLRNSFCVGPAAGVYAEGAHVVLRNVTAMGAQCGINASGEFLSPIENKATSLSMINTIAQDSPILDLSATADVCLSHLGHGVTAHADHSSYGTVDEDGSQTVLFTSDADVTGAATFATKPGLVNAYMAHESPASPTVASGLVDPANGATDIDGDPRVSACTGAPTTDAGADQIPDSTLCPGGPTPPPTTTTPPPPPPPPPTTTTPAPKPPPVVAPLLSKVKIVHAGTAVSFHLSRAAKVTGVLDLRTHGGWQELGGALAVRESAAGTYVVKFPTTINDKAVPKHGRFRLHLTARDGKTQMTVVRTFRR